MRPISTNLIAHARKMRAQGMGWRKIANELGTTDFHIRSALDQNYRPRKRFREHEKRLNARALPVLERDHIGRELREHGPPPATLAMRERLLEARRRRSPQAAMLGDPAPGQSALDRKQGRDL